MSGKSAVIFENLLAPEECQGMDDIRAEIDRIDRAVVALLGRRYRYVLAASPCKTSAAAVRAQERFDAMLARRREWAAAEGLDPAAIGRFYEDLVNHFIEEEMKHWQSGRDRG
jgi:isochorismate pyruvate lyase